MEKPTTRALSGDVAQPEYDVCVIGGGVNGLAIARDAVLRGLRVVVVERGDICSGTSAWSTRLVHGGLKYLEQLDLRLVVESIRERAGLLRNAPHLVRPYPMLIPFYRHSRRSRQLVRLGLTVHDLMAVRGGLDRSRGVSRTELDRTWSGLSQHDLRGAVLYHDAQAPWAERLCVEMALDAVAQGAALVTRATALGPGRVRHGSVHVRVADTTTGREETIRTRTVVNAAGPWVDRVLGDRAAGHPLIGGTKGSHVVVDPFPGAPPTCVFFEARSDGRPMFVLPWAGRYLIGTTDVAVDGDLDELTASDAEIAYLTGEAGELFPDSKLSARDVLYSYAGVRPLPFAPTAKDNADISRGHTIVTHGGDLPGVVSVVGGKLTTHRALAEDVVDAVLKVLGRPRRPARTRSRQLPGAVGFDRRALRAALLRDGLLGAGQADRLLDIYGARTKEVARLAAEQPTLRATIDDETGALAAEVVVALGEGAATIADILFRRTMVGYNGEVGRTAASAAADVLAATAGWSDDTIARQLRDFEAERRRYRPRDVQAL